MDNSEYYNNTINYEINYLGKMRNLCEMMNEQHQSNAMKRV